MEIEKKWNKIHMEPEKIQDSQRNPEKKNNTGRVVILELEINYRAIVMKSMWCFTEADL